VSQQPRELVGEWGKVLPVAALSGHPLLNHFSNAMTQGQIRSFAIHWRKMTHYTDGLASAVPANPDEHFQEAPDLATREKLAGETVVETTGIACGGPSHCHAAIKFAESLAVSCDGSTGPAIFYCVRDDLHWINTA
jgi:hypothetical protein